MAINVTCSSCRYSSKVPEEHAGKEVICPQCGNSFKVPGPGSTQPQPKVATSQMPEAGLTRPCPHCNRTINAGVALCIWCGMPVSPPQADVTEVVRQSPAAVENVAPDVLPETKTCPFCAETIKTAARKCPHCGEILDRQLAQARRGAGPGRQAQVYQLQDAEKKARDALILSIFGLACGFFGFIVGPIAIIQGVTANKEFARMQRPSNGMATTAIVLGCVDIVAFIIFLIVAASGGFE